MESEQKYKITIKPFSDGKLIQSYKSNPEFGYLILESNEPFLCPTIISDVQLLETFDAKSFKFPKRQALIRTKIDTLEKFIKSSTNRTLPGRIRITEYLEDEIPEEVIKLNIRDDIPFEEAIKPYLLVFNPKNDSIENKIRDRFREKSNDEVLTKNGKRIVRFFTWDIDNKEDILIKGYDFKLSTYHGITTIEELEAQEYERQKKKIKKVKEIEGGKKGEKNENTISQNTERSKAAVKRENALIIPLVTLLVLGAIVALIMLPSLFTIVSVIAGLLIIFYFAGAFYEAIFSKSNEFDLVKTILIGVIIILVIGAIMVINELTKTPHDPDMWRHP
jgi:hypothetical protein